jgi:hypothetical protein
MVSARSRRAVDRLCNFLTKNEDARPISSLSSWTSTCERVSASAHARSRSRGVWHRSHDMREGTRAPVSTPRRISRTIAAKSASEGKWLVSRVAQCAGAAGHSHLPPFRWTIVSDVCNGGAHSRPRGRWLARSDRRQRSGTVSLASRAPLRCPLGRDADERTCCHPGE